MRSFVLHMGGKALTWFMGLDKGTISSFKELVETFYNHWDSGNREEWIPHVKHAKDLFSKESQNEDQFEEVVVQHLNNDILSTIDEASQEDEYDDGPIYDDLEFLIEESEEQEDRTILPFQHTKTPCDVLDLWEHNNKNSKDEGWVCVRS